MTLHRIEAEALFHEGNLRAAGGDAAGAEQCLRRALLLAPDFGEALANLGLLREDSGALAEAEACYRQAIDLCPRLLQAYLILGALLLKNKDFIEADTVSRQSVQLAPEAPAAWSNLGVLLACTKREVEAERCYRTALALDSEHAMARFNLAYILLRQGRLEEGWSCLEERAGYARLTAYFTCRRWRGEALDGKSVLIGFEGGQGDMIQFCRYASVLKTRGAACVTVVCHPSLKTLFTTLSGVDAVFSFEDEVSASDWDFWTPPMSLPHYCNTRLDSIPAPIPYLAPDPARVAQWSAQLSAQLPCMWPASGLRVGLAWKGNSCFENDADRSLPSLDLLAPIGAVAGVHFISLQKGEGEQEALRPPGGMSLLALGGALQDFADTAAVMASLDLVISVDTAVAHLAGSLGIPCWVLLPDYRTDWRWLTGRTDTPWYPQRMRLFRQTEAGGWPALVAQVQVALESWAASAGRAMSSVPA